MSTTILKLTKPARPGGAGLYPLTLARLVDGAEKGKVTVWSGGADRQLFRRAGDPDSLSGSREPIPEGVYDLGGPDWAARPGDYSASHGPGLGAFWVAIRPKVIMDRGDFGIHMDANRQSSPGSAGCVVAPDQAALEIIVGWFNVRPPSELHVDWGLGTFPAARQAYTKVFLNGGRVRGYLRGREVSELEVTYRLAAGALHAFVNGKEVKPTSVASELGEVA